MQFRNIRIAVKLAIGFGIALLSLCLIGGTAMFQVSRVYRGTEDIAKNWLPSVQTLSDIRASANAVRRATLVTVVTTDAQEKARQLQKHTDSLQALNGAMSRYESMLSSPEERQIFSDMKAALSVYLKEDEKIAALMQQGDSHFDEARKLAGNDSSLLLAPVMELIDKDVAINRKGANDAAEAASDNYRTTVLVTAVMIAAALLASVVVAVLITRSIVAPIRRSVAFAETVAQGDLTSAITDDAKDETGQLLRALHHMNQRLSDLVGKVRAGSQSIATASAQIAAGNTDLSQRTEEQAASLQETAASMEELTSAVKQNSENAMQGNELAANASEVAERGGVVVSRVVETMRDISTSSAKVAEIIAVIEGIAFQTNILALNAAVEAARAGEDGRGFAVVAGEVRTLAQRSATAAKEIKDLIGASVDKVNVGSQLVEEAGLTMTEVVSSVKRVADLMGAISTASTQQHAGIEQVNVAVSQMDEVTQQNAALVEQASAAAQSMAQQSSELRDVVSVFKVKDNNHIIERQPVMPAATTRPQAARRSAPMPSKAVKPIVAAELVSADSGDWSTF
ncbi:MULTISPECIES: methyl-accepting chemotaxis protein [unclassified Caballeronia]|uniref:methyl-accepting chemotaxis protein n=1 Tax=unclassified Caballeronia TaxID=2646786 RepID=UPI00285CB5ED|nr:MULTISPECIES: methyl-accepting chemotaxis protein [unclassified Caballeronia]MDR5740572.1 methyl-accepting chemotaxis protein [Caballeronia sp. LZ016]MDR5808907.1 methyl-accepting chemotaxis protein [Caballeronia sp. LZ019]